MADINMARQTSGFWHIKLTLATFMPMLESVIALSLRLHSGSCRYLPDETPKPTTCMPPEIDLRHDCGPLLIREGDMALDAGIWLLAPAPL